MATVDFMRKLVENTDADIDQDHVPTIVCSACDIPERMAGIAGTGPDPLPAMIAVVRRLETAGATRIAIACNTAHHWHPALQAAATVPILHIVDAVADTLAQGGIGAGPVGLLATTGTLTLGLYQNHLEARGFVCRVPDSQDDVVRAIALVKAGAIEEASVILRAQARVLLDRGCRTIVLACTEIPIALDPRDEEWDGALVDATDALARACITACGAKLRAPARSGGVLADI